MITKSNLNRLVTFLLMIPFCSISQVNYLVLDQNDTKATFSNTGTQFHNYSTGEAGYMVPKVNGYEQFYQMQFWYAGKDSNGQLHTCLGGDLNGTDVFPGPGSANSNPTMPWMFEISQSEMDAYHLYWMCTFDPDSVDNCGSSTIPSNNTLSVVYNWPELFPYVDYDNNGAYNYEYGDYPIIKGCKAIFMIQNDVDNVHTYSGGSQLGIDMYYLFYQFSNSTYLKDVTFMDVCVINKSLNTYTDFNHGVLFDHELSADYSLYGCDSSKRVAYTYYPTNSSTTYASNPPAIGVVELNRQSTSIQPLNNYGNLNEAWELLNGRKKTGDDWLDLDGNESLFAFNGNPDNINSWNQVSHPDSLDYNRFLISTNAGTLNPNEGLVANYAIVYSRVGNNFENSNRVLMLADSLVSFYNSDINTPCFNGWLGIKQNTLESLVVYPNPAADFIHVSNVIGEHVNYQLIDNQGKIVQSGRFTDTIDIHTIEQGVYTLVIQTENENRYQRFIKNN